MGEGDLMFGELFSLNCNIVNKKVLQKLIKCDIEDKHKYVFVIRNLSKTSLVDAHEMYYQINQVKKFYRRVTLFESDDFIIALTDGVRSVRSYLANCTCPPLGEIKTIDSDILGIRYSNEEKVTLVKPFTRTEGMRDVTTPINAWIDSQTLISDDTSHLTNLVYITQTEWPIVINEIEYVS